MDITEEYSDFIKPSNFITDFKSKEEFEVWLGLGTLEDLKCCLNVFTEDELYEYCSIIENYIKNNYN